MSEICRDEGHKVARDRPFMENNRKYDAHCTRCGVIGLEENLLPTPEQQRAAHFASLGRYEMALQDWKDNGRRGDPPSRPIPPHTPGWGG